jgi:lipooligosaccharide transport system permease protein
MTFWKPHLGALLDWRARAVVFRNWRVWQRNWKTSFLPPAMEPVIYFLAFGLGLGSQVGPIQHDGRAVPYATWIAPGLVAYGAFATAYYEALYGSYVRMFYQKTWDSILATQVEIHHIAWGEVLWAGVRSAMNAGVVALVLGVGHAAGAVDLQWGWLPLLPLVAFVVAWTFASFALIFTALVPSIDHMNYAVFLVGVPLSFTSNTYFPVDSAWPWVAALMQANPVYHMAGLFRALIVGGEPWRSLGMLVLTSSVGLVIAATAAQRLTRRRVIGD